MTDKKKTQIDNNMEDVIKTSKEMRNYLLNEKARRTTSTNSLPGQRKSKQKQSRKTHSHRL